MARDITDALAAWVARQPPRRRPDAQAVAFLAVRADVVKALEAGYSIKTVWAFLKDEGRITSSYEMFRRHVQRHIKKEPTPPTADKAKGEPATQEKEGSKAKRSTTPQSKKPEPAGIASFNYNPKMGNFSKTPGSLTTRPGNLRAGG